MKGRWSRVACRISWLQAGGRCHACVFFDTYADAGYPWCVWTHHTEGRDHFATEREAKLHARKRLRQLLRDTEGLR